MLSLEANYAISLLVDHLRTRSAVLFTGAGVNYGLEDSEGNKFPLGAGLATEITNKLLKDEGVELPLADAADMARRKFTDTGLNRFCYDIFKRYSPGVAHYAACRVPWNAIYTTNYDTLIEKSAQKKSFPLVPIHSIEFDLSELRDTDIPYYKIHGCIDHANTPAGRLVLTPEDYRVSEVNRRTLFSRLRRDMLSKVILFVGYGFRDDNLRQILDEVRYALGTEGLPPSFAIRKNFSKSELEYWKDKYNVQFIDADASEFLTTLADAYCSEEDDGRKKLAHPLISQETEAFQIVSGCFQLIVPEACAGASNPQRFFRGGRYGWPDARDKIASPRDDYWNVLEFLFADFADPTSVPTSYLIDGAAGTGKSALCHMLAYDSVAEFGAIVLWHLPGTPLDASGIGALINTDSPVRILVFVKDGASHLADIDTFFNEVRRLRWPISLVIEERRNEWISARSRGKHINPTEVTLSTVSGGEIDRILDSLAKYDCLGKLNGLPREHQREHFAHVASKDLLVALREITSDGNFDDIVRDEFDSVPSDLAKRAYLYVSAVGQANVPLRYEHLVRLTKIGHDQLGSLILKPTDQVLIDSEPVGVSHASAGYALRARHPVIASIIFNHGAPNDTLRMGLLLEIVDNLDPGYPEDRKLLEQFVLRHEIVQTMSNPDYCRTVFDQVASKLPLRSFVPQQRAILERHLGSSDKSVEFAQEALKLDPHNLSIKNTLGFSLEYKARMASDAVVRAGFLRQARNVFEEVQDRDPSNSYNYIGLARVMRTEAESLQTPAERTLAHAEIIDFLEGVLDQVDQTEIIAKTLAEEQCAAGDPQEALAIVLDALKRKEDDNHLRHLEVKLKQSVGDLVGATQAALIGLRHDPNSWQLNLALARLLRLTGGKVAAVRGHYEAARRHRARDINLCVEYGAFLFMSDVRAKSAEVFQGAQSIPGDVNFKRKVREVWKQDSGGRDRVFTGRVKQRSGTKVVIVATPENFEVPAWLTGGTLRVGDTVHFTVVFDAFGAKGRVSGGSFRPM